MAINHVTHHRQIKIPSKRQVRGAAPTWRAGSYSSTLPVRAMISKVTSAHVWFTHDVCRDIVNECRHINEGLRCEQYRQISKAACRLANVSSTNQHNGITMMHIMGICYQARRYGDTARHYTETVETDPYSMDVLQGLGLALE